MFHIIIEHPPYDEELEVARTTTAIQNPQLQRPITGEDLIAFQRLVRKAGIEVRPILTRAGAQFVTPLSLAALSEDKVYTDLFSLTDEAEMGHI